MVKMFILSIRPGSNVKLNTYSWILRDRGTDSGGEGKSEKNLAKSTQICKFEFESWIKTSNLMH